MTREEERRIIADVQSGNTAVFEKLVLEHQDKVYGLALRMTGEAEEARDLSQEAFLRAFKSLDSFRGDSKFSVWLYRLTSNLCYDYLRVRSRRQPLSLTVGEDDEDSLAELEIPDRRFNPETKLEQKEMARAISEGLSALSPEYRHILILREINGLSYADISQILGLEEGTVKSRIFRARKKLCAAILSEGNIYGGLSSKESGGGVNHE